MNHEENKTQWEVGDWVLHDPARFGVNGVPPNDDVADHRPEAGE